MSPIHDEEPCATTTPLARVMADDSAVVGTPVVPTALDRATAVAVEVVWRASIVESSQELAANDTLYSEAPTRAHTGRLGAAHDASLDADWMAVDERTQHFID